MKSGEPSWARELFGTPLRILDFRDSSAGLGENWDVGLGVRDLMGLPAKAWEEREMDMVVWFSKGGRYWGFGTRKRRLLEVERNWTSMTIAFF